MADEGAVDVDEPRGEQPAPVSHPPIVGPSLSDVQRAHIHYSNHTNDCYRCRDIDRGRCTVGEQLWRDWNAACDDAYWQLHAKTR
jgi:hypothetical protein